MINTMIVALFGAGIYQMYLFYKGLDKELNPISEVIGNIYEHPHLLEKGAEG